MPWEKLIEEAPAIGAISFLVTMGAWCFWRMVQKFMETQAANLVQLQRLSETCHASHKENAEIAASAIRENTEELKESRESQHKTQMVVKELTLLLKTVNGRLSAGGGYGGA